MSENTVLWVVNDNGELGVKVGGDHYFLYKGGSIVYRDAHHDDGREMFVRTVGKREFGESCYPLNVEDPRKNGTVSLTDCDRWEPLSPSALPEAV